MKGEKAIEPQWRNGHKDRKEGKESLLILLFASFALFAPLRLSPVSIQADDGQCWLS
jgi:hypothetical protein